MKIAFKNQIEYNKYAKKNLKTRTLRNLEEVLNKKERTNKKVNSKEVPLIASLAADSDYTNLRNQILGRPLIKKEDKE